MMSYDCFFWNIWEIGEKRKKLEEEKGIIIRFVIGHRWVSLPKLLDKVVPIFCSTILLFV